MRGHVRELTFSKMVTGQPVTARCSVCKRVFIAKPDGPGRTDDLLLRVRAEFEQHSCDADVKGKEPNFRSTG
jgi:hypothetical protein